MKVRDLVVDSWCWGWPTGRQPFLCVDNLAYQYVEPKLCENEHKDQKLVTMAIISIGKLHPNK